MHAYLTLFPVGGDCSPGKVEAKADTVHDREDCGIEPKCCQGKAENRPWGASGTY